MAERLDDINFQVNSDLDGKFDFILTDKDLSKNLGVNYTICGTPTDEDYDDMMFEGRTDDEDEVIDKYLNMNFIFYVGTNDEHCGTVVKWSQGLDGRTIVSSHTNPFFDTREYEIEFTDGTRDKYTTDIIAGDMYVQVDDEVHQFQLLAEIKDHRKYGTEISKEEGNIRSTNFIERDKITTRGC